MAKPTGFMEYKREDPQKLPVKERIKNYKEFEQPLSEDRLQKQAARCMDCGIPYCHSYGCPIKNRIPDWNDMVYKGKWKRALDLLHYTINFPEFTGRVCPSPCETACTLSINQPAVTIRNIELQIVEKGWQEGWIQPESSPFKSGKKVAIVGSGPAGLTAAQQLVRKGHDVVVFEKEDRIGGLLRYGIPDFKLEKYIIDRRIEQMKKEGVIFESEVHVGKDISARYLKRTFDAILITAGATAPRDLNVPGRQLKGVHFAMDFLTQQNKKVAGDNIPESDIITAKNKTVIIIGGGDTGSDCVGTSRRQGAKEIIQIELLPKPPKERELYNPWPTWPNILRTSSSHEEGCERQWSILTKELVGNSDGVKQLKGVKLNWSKPEKDKPPKFKEIPNSEFKLNADLILLAMGFVHVEHGPLVNDFELELDNRGNVRVDSNYMTTVPGIFAAGDSVMGASLVVRAFYQAREAAEGVDRFLMD